jgi:mono/diheme cytochrome c family protein
VSRRFLVVALIAVVVVVVGAGALYEWLVPGLSSARSEPGPLETKVATWLLHRSVPEQEKARVNPLASDPAEIAAGRDLFGQKCEACHGYDGGGKTEIGSGQYPRPPALRPNVASTPDGEIFYHIRNGIRNTGMPAWQLPDQQIWQLVAFIRHLPLVAPLAAAAANSEASTPPSANYAGSASCQKCHEDIYARWSKSRMTNVVRDPRQHPDAIIPDLSKPDPLVNFSKDDIAFVYGSRWKQRYFAKVGDDYFPEPAQWGRHARNVAALFRTEHGRLVGAALSVGQFQAADRAALRWLPFSELRYRDENGQRMERRLREVPRRGKRPCCPADAGQHPQSRALQLCACQRRLHPMSLAGPSSEQPDRREVLRLARRFPRRIEPCRFLAA